MKLGCAISTAELSLNPTEASEKHLQPMLNSEAPLQGRGARLTSGRSKADRTGHSPYQWFQLLVGVVNRNPVDKWTLLYVLHLGGFRMWAL